MPWLTLDDGARLHLRVIGRGRPCVLLHGLGFDAFSWVPFVLPHLHRCRFVIPDMRGYGRSRDLPLEADYVYGQYARDVAQVVAAQGEPVLLGGISMGAAVGLEYLARFGGDRVRGYLHIDHPAHCVAADRPDILPAAVQDAALVLLALYREGGWPRNTPFARLPRSFREQHFELFSDILMYSVGRDYQKRLTRTLRYSPTVRTLALRLAAIGDWYAVLCCLQAYLSGRFDVRAAVRELQPPITLLVGLRDHLFPLDEHLFIHRNAPHSRLVEFRRSGHLLMVTEPLRFQKVLARFLARPDGRTVSPV